LANDPFVKVLWFGIGDAAFQRGVNHAIHAIDLVLGRQHGDVVLEGVWHPEVLAADIADALVGVPILVIWERFIDAIVEVLVVGEDDMTANVVELEGEGRVR
jgi:hypothetical protein